MEEQLPDPAPAPAIQVPIRNLPTTETIELLTHGEISLLGRLPWSSNNAFLAVVSANGVDIGVVYKPGDGEQPLYDFDAGTLYKREVAAFAYSEFLGLGIVPESVLRIGPLGEGMVQRFVDHNPQQHYFTLLAENSDRFRAFALFDVLVNNADRKGGHCLFDRQRNQIVGIDHGLTFHDEWKLRTVIWDFESENLQPEELELVERAVKKAPDQLNQLLTKTEIEAVSGRAEHLKETHKFPAPTNDPYPLPWPLI